MIRAALAYLLSGLLVLASLVLADAEGASRDLGTDVVICSGIGLTTITLGPDGQPVKTTEPCPDGTSIFTATFALPVLPVPEARLVAFGAPLPGRLLGAQDEFSPAARDPPAAA